MTFEEFKKVVQDDLLQWISRKERPASGWFLSVEEWATRRFDEAYKREYPPRAEDGLLTPNPEGG
jgi:hypothetical protein